MNKEHKIHAFYILLILISIIIGLISFQWHDIPKLVELVTFALTVTSLVLAILAIAYAVYTNSSFTTNITTLNKASQEISTTAKDVSDAAKELKGKIELIPSKLESMEGRFDEIKSLIQPFEIQETRQPSEKEKKATSEIANLFTERLPLGGLITIYALFRAYKEKKTIDFKDLFTSLKSVGDNYAYGLYAGIYAAGLLNSQSKGSRKSVITGFDDRLSSKVETNFDSILNKAYEKYTNQNGKKEAEQAKIMCDLDVKVIDAYFST